MAAWGHIGLLGNNIESTDGYVSVNMSGVLAGKSAIALAAGGSHSLALAADPVPDSNANGILDSWEAAHFGNADAGTNLPGDDADHDGLSNLLEYALDTNPLTSNASPLANDLETIGEGQHLRMTVQKNAAATNLTYVVETCGDLQNWSALDTTIEANTAALLIVRDNFDATAPARRFVRLRVQAAP